MTTGTHEPQTESQAVERTSGGRVYRPQVDILEGPEGLTLVADMPGAKSDAIDIHFEEGVLSIQGKVEPRHQPGRKLLLSEYGVGDFYRTFRIGEQINVGGISAEYTDGVLSVHLPKAESAKPRKLTVHTAQ